MRMVFPLQAPGALVSVLFVCAVTDGAATTKLGDVPAITGPVASLHNVNVSRNTRAAASSHNTEKHRPVASGLSAKHWHRLPNSIVNAIVGTARNRGRSTAEAALHAFLPLLRELVKSGNLLQQALATNTTRRASKQCIHHLVDSIMALLTARPWAVKSKGDPKTARGRLHSSRFISFTLVCWVSRV